MQLLRRTARVTESVQKTLSMTVPEPYDAIQCSHVGLVRALGTMPLPAHQHNTNSTPNKHTCKYRRTWSRDLLLHELIQC